MLLSRSEFANFNSFVVHTIVQIVSEESCLKHFFLLAKVAYFIA